MKRKPILIIILVCLLGIAITSGAYLWRASRADLAFAGELDVAGLDRLIAAQESFTVYFYGLSCADCARSEPDLRQAVEQLRAAHDLTDEVYKCERDANATVRSLYGIEQTPTLVIYENGIEVRRLEGPAENMQAYLDFFSGKSNMPIAP